MLAPSDKTAMLAEAIERIVRPGDAIHLGTTHVRGSAAAWEILRQFRGRDPGFELQSVAMSTPLAPLVHERLARRIVTTWSGDAYYSPGPNPVYRQAHADGVEFSHWSIATFPQRLAAAARGLAWTTTRSLAGSQMAADNAADLKEIEPGLMLMRSLTPDVSLFHAPAADPAGNVLVTPPLFENVWGALAARKGAIVTVERLVDESYVRDHSALTRIPSYAVAAVVEVPFGGHPGGIFTRGLPGIGGYGEDYAFWAEMRAACRDPSALDAWIKRWILEPADRAAYCDLLGRDRLDALVANADPQRIPPEVAAALDAVDLDAEPNEIETAIVAGARLLAERVRAGRLTYMLAGAGMANLAAWLAAETLRDGGAGIDLVAEMGLVGYRPHPGEPFIFNHRNFPACSMLADIDVTMNVLMGGARARSIASLGAAQVDRRGNLNTTVSGDRLLMGSGGANDVATCATETVLTMIQTADRFVDRVDYVTSPGDRVVAMASTLGVFRKDQGELVLTGVYGDDPVEAARAARDQCGWDLRVARSLERVEPPTPAEIRTLRRFDPNGYFRTP